MAIADLYEIPATVVIFTGGALDGKRETVNGNPPVTLQLAVAPPLTLADPDPYFQPLTLRYDFTGRITDDGEWVYRLASG